LKKYLNILKKCPLFENIEEENLLRMLVCLVARVEYFDKKYTVFSEGSPAKCLGIVLSGSVQTVQIDFDGNRSILGEMNASEVFAEAFACAEVTALPVSIIMNEPGEIMLIECSHVLHTCDNHCGFHQQLIFNLMKDLALKTLFFHQRMEITSKRTTREKLLAYLHSQVKKTGSFSFEIPFDRQELADFLEVDRSGLSSEIGKLKKEGIIQAEKNKFTIL
jgi:CRP-like cAMP-binding protein